MSEELKTGVLDAYLFLRKNNHDISDNVLEFINNSVDKIKQLEQENLELKATQNSLALKLRLLRESAIGEDTGEIYLDLTQESEQIALHDDISNPLKQLAEHDKQVAIDAVRRVSNFISYEYDGLSLIHI